MQGEISQGWNCGSVLTSPSSPFFPFSPLYSFTFLVESLAIYFVTFSHGKIYNMIMFSDLFHKHTFWLSLSMLLNPQTFHINPFFLFRNRFSFCFSLSLYIYKWKNYCSTRMASIKLGISFMLLKTSLLLFS